MSHIISFEEIFIKTFILQHLSLGSKAYCKDRLCGSEIDQGNYELDIYWGSIKSIACSYLLECSIKLRVIQDSIKKDSIKIDDLDKKARRNITIGSVLYGEFHLNIRESCNKIIHATNVIPIMKKNIVDDYEY